jgi:hypothetical protein
MLKKKLGEIDQRDPHAKKVKKFARMKTQGLFKVKSAVENTRGLRDMGFFKQPRSAEAFMRVEATSSAAPSECWTSFRERTLTSRRSTYTYLLAYTLPGIVDVALMYAFLSGSIGTYLSIREAETRESPFPTDTWEQGVLESIGSISATVSDFKFLPTLFVVQYFFRGVNKWMNLVDQCFSMQGKVHDIALLIGSGMQNVAEDTPEARRRRAVLFRIYRYLNCFHAWTYCGADPRIKDADSLLNAMLDAGLLTEEEVAEVTPMEKKTDAFLNWLGQAFMQELDHGSIRPHLANTFMQQLCRLRGTQGTLDDLLVMHPPISLSSMAYVLIDAYITLVLVSYPFSKFAPGVCFQFASMVSAFLVGLCYSALLRVSFIMNLPPFDPKGDCVNVDATLCASDTHMYTFLRMNLGSIELDPPASLSREHSL